MKLAFPLLLILPLPVTLQAQSVPPVVRTDYDMQELAKPPALSTNELAGRKLFAQYCSLCHDPLAHQTRLTYGPLLDESLVKAVGEDKVREQIRSGSLRMPGFQYQLKLSQVDSIIAFLKTYSSLASLAKGATSANEVGAAEQVARPLQGKRKSLIKGSIRARTGEALAGIAVSARADGKTVTTTVFADEHGKFQFPQLVEGTYSVWAQAVGYTTVRSKVNLTSHTGQLSLRLLDLKDADDISMQLSGAEWLESLPDQTEEDRRHKEMFRLSCTDCHQPNLPLQRRFDEQGWTAITRFMLQQANYFYGWAGPASTRTVYEGQADTEKGAESLADELAKYLAKVRGPNSVSPKWKLLPRPVGAAARVAITGYDIPPADTPHELSWQDGSAWSDGAATGMHGAVGVHDVVVDSRGNAWLTESVHDNSRMIIKVDAASGQVTKFFFVPPPGISWSPLATHGIGMDSKGNLWFGLTWKAIDGGPDGELVKISPETDAFERFSLPAQMRNAFSVVTVDADAHDKIWVSAVTGATRFDPETKTFSYWHNLIPELNPSSFTYGTTGDSVGHGWWTVPLSDRVETVNPATGEAHTFIMRPLWASEETIAGSGGFGLQPGQQYPRRLGADKNGTDVWVPNYFGRNLAKINIKSKSVTYFKVPINSHPYFAQVDKNHVVWMNLMSDDRVASFDPQSQQWIFYRLPVNGCESRNIAVDDRTGDVWVPCYRASKVFRLQFRTPRQVYP